MLIYRFTYTTFHWLQTVKNKNVGGGTDGYVLRRGIGNAE